MGLRKIYILLFILGLRALSAQEEVYISFLQDSAAVGEMVDLLISTEQDPALISELEWKALEDIKFFSPISEQKDTIIPEKPDLNINSLGSWEDKNNDGRLSGDELAWETVTKDDKTIYRNRIRVAFFDVGIYAFDGFSYSYSGRTSTTNRAIIKITFKDYNLQVVDSTGLAPIKNIEKEPLKFQDFLPFLLYLLVPLLLIYLGYRYYQKKKEKDHLQIEEEVVVIPPDVKALTELKDLRNKELWQKGEIKQYQSELSHIIREYMEGRYDIKALESTTSQIIRSIKDRSFTVSDQETLKRILQISDLVKFAKAKPEVNIHEKFMNDAVAFIQRTRKRVDEEEE